jgi:hypothetical protein
MCAQYWSLLEERFAPCGHTITEFQTHWRGDEEFGWTATHRMGELLSPDLTGYSGKLSDEGEEFIGDCPTCGAFFQAEGMITDGRVTGIGPLIPA